ncbi:uncharacterized protein RBU57_014798 [Macrochelys suwanniensis]
MAERSEGAELTLPSGEGECETSVCDTDGEPRCHVAEPTGDVCLAGFRARPQPLSMETLQGARDGLERRGELGEELGSCLDLALERFCREPQCVQENARLRIRWAGGELEFIAGQGQCGISVSCSAGEPQYHVTEKTWDVFAAWTNSHPEPLSVKTLERVRNTLGCWGALGEELSGCLAEAVSQFSREPRCVQENARLEIQCGRRQLRFTSGKGKFEISVRYGDGKPEYRVVKIPVHVYLAQLRARRESLSADTLQTVLSELGSCQGDTAELRACLHTAWEGFCREPPCVQENARLRIQWGGGSLQFLSGEGECEISVRYRDGRPQYEVGELPVHMYLAQLRARPDPLSVDTLRGVRDKLASCKGDRENLKTCFDRAWEGFRQEPRCVQENARLRIQWGGGELELVSGQGQCEISVLLADGEPQYHITELGGDRPVTWSHASPESLSVADLARVRDRLGRWGALGEGLSGCFGEAVSQFSREPPCVQENARLRIQWDGGTLQFLSGKGQCEISVCYREGKPRYDIRELPVHMYLDWLCANPDPLSADTLQGVRDKLGSCKGDKANLIACFHLAWDGFHQEPQDVQENARLLIQCNRRKLQFTSGKGECALTVRYGARGPQYRGVKITLPVCDK